MNVAVANNMVESVLPLPIGNQSSVLTDIYQPENNIAIWQRTLPIEMTTSIQEMLQNSKPLALVKYVTPDDVAEWIRGKLDGYACANALSEDIALIVDMFCCLFDTKEAGLRLTTLDKPMCPKFHVDQIPCRLVTTYVGTATEWLDNQDVNRGEQGASALGQISSDAQIQQISAGDVALLKGSGWEGNENTGLVHRSPAVNLNEPRLLLTLDIV
ncbi:DUF1826 domain-containing protein [Psychromonas sp. B3M02]|uniref:DUF1826 domain-containing protein n=1 Tax=Psychromonas sp. B3M02 TaxID=2267226 RepID=UPI000DEBB75E|nr:DUF1826 domain-containing protein [Psychromonas sp. B3M02]RBW46893.1 DUF1826 domain-containing protein [Psychromonas sp. B3M02]